VQIKWIYLKLLYTYSQLQSWGQYNMNHHFDTDQKNMDSLKENNNCSDEGVNNILMKE
jgi:hypothetical protein